MCSEIGLAVGYCGAVWLAKGSETRARASGVEGNTSCGGLGPQCEQSRAGPRMEARIFKQSGNGSPWVSHGGPRFWMAGGKRMARSV